MQSPNLTDLINKPFCHFSSDVEEHSLWFNTLRDETGSKVLSTSMPKLLELYEYYSIKSTFFVTGYMGNKFPEIVRMIANQGHEIGSHGKSHLKENGFDVMPYEKQLRHLDYSKKLLEDISGSEVISFRAPALRINEDTTRALIKTGFRIDSSVSSQRFDFGFSFGSKQKAKRLFAPRLPYKTSPESLYLKGDGPMVEVPVSAIILPYIGATMRIFPFATKFLRAILNWESQRNGKPIVFYSHPAEFLDETNEPRIIHKRTDGNTEYFFRDWLRTKLKTKNLGPVALALLTEQIEYFKRRNYNFTSIRDYCINKRLL
jgi:peptidoglycan-N-acetylglucosamine deacetylase